MQSTTQSDPAGPTPATADAATDAGATQSAAKTSCGCCAVNAAPAAGGAGAEDAAGGASCHVGGTQEARITVKGGYSPATVRLTAGVPARLVFDRQEASRCSEELLIPAFGVRQPLPQGRETVVEFTPTAPGTFPFTCGMEMLRGELVVAASGS